MYFFKENKTENLLIDEDVYQSATKRTESNWKWLFEFISFTRWCYQLYLLQTFDLVNKPETQQIRFISVKTFYNKKQCEIKLK